MTAALQIVESRIGNVEAEVAVIGAMLCEPKVIDQLADTLSPDDFAEPFLGFVYGTILREHALGRALNPITIRPFLESETAFAEMGGKSWLADLGAQPLSLIGARTNARQVAEFAQRRRLVEGLRDAIALASDYDQPVEALVLAADNAITAARESDGPTAEMSGAQCLDAVIQGFERPVTGVECGNIPSLDRLLGPLRPSHFVVGAGRPGMGKTATAISYALGAASRGHGVLFVSLEMSGEELGERMAADLCLDQRVPYEKIRDRTLNADQKREICRARARLEEMPLQIVDKAGLKLAQLRSRVRRWSRRFAARGDRLELVIVDYLQLLRPDRQVDRFEAVGEISRTLKEIAKEHGVAVLALAQLSRAVEARADKRPMLSDLRESGQIEQDADAVVFFLRDEYYLRAAEPLEGDPKRDEWDRRLQACQGRIEFILAKRRNGPTGALVGDFLYHFQAVRG
ncbi:MAG: replicative helicase [Sphingomonadales bacterium]|jgi:replicative DNA helicase|nr:replicative helicase [Sphingomonadales bacterium]